MMNPSQILGRCALGIVITLSACTAPQAPAHNDLHPIGGKKDQHGCLVAAGQTWSQLQNNCIQVFQVAQRLNPVEEGNTASISAFILFNDDRSKAELFLPDGANILLQKTSPNTLENKDYQYNTTTQSLSIQQKLRYRADQR